jgi:hypothetical protein
MPAPIQPTLLHRLPPAYRHAQTEDSTASTEVQSAIGTDPGRLYQRHKGGLLARALGTAVHTLLENLARLRRISTWDESRAALKQLQPHVAAQIRTAGLDSSQASDLAAKALSLALAASNDPTGNWILSPHREEASEVRWTGVVSGGLRTVQVDRLFRAGLEPLSTSDESWWIIDYKTAHADTLDPGAALPQLRAIFAPQLEAYAEVLRSLHGTSAPIRAGLYYPRMLLFDWWEI